MNCRHTTESYTLWREGALPWWRRAMMRFHQAVCPACPIYLSQMDETVRRLRGLGPTNVEPPKEMIDALLARDFKEP